jgi:D-3-phosphoglycerate dehydrogenase
MYTIVVVNLQTSNTKLIFDFDSTFVTVEALDELAAISLAHAPDKEKRIAAITDITARGMAGELSFGESLARRFEQLTPTKQHVDRLISLLKQSVSPSFAAHKSYLQANAESIWIISGGFSDVIIPVVTEYGLLPNHVLANHFVWDSPGQTAVGYSHDSPLAHTGGKIKALQSLNFPHSASIVMVGDGMTDYLVRGVGAADVFIAYTETIRREPTVAVADYAAASFDDVLAYVA